MKITILADFHFGFGGGNEWEKDSFENAKEAMQIATNADLILIGGDIFDYPAPKTQVWAKALRILTEPLLKPNPEIKLVSCSKVLRKVSERVLDHVPVIALHGNHERKARVEFNAIQALENAGILIHLNKDTIVFEKNGIKVAIHGMSSVPERYAKDFLEEWRPKPLAECVNILFLHQSIYPYVFSPLEPPSLSLSNLPKGFDIIIDAHVHNYTQDKVNGSIFLIPGSLVVTQFEKNEALMGRGLLELGIGEELKVNFVPLKTNRKFFYEEVTLNALTDVEQIEKKIDEIIYVKNLPKPPLVKFKLIGKEVAGLEQELKRIEAKYRNKSILIFSKELESPEITKKIELLRSLREQKISIEEMGLNILKENLEELKFKSILEAETLFKLLSEGEVEKALNLLLGEQKTLPMFK
jgi:DNA repair exonuclease SbcCD nuclease subunit